MGGMANGVYSVKSEVVFLLRNTLEVSGSPVGTLSGKHTLRILHNRGFFGTCS